MKALLTALFLLMLPSLALADDTAPAAGAWLTLVDTGHYGQSWQDAATLFQSRVTSESWTRSIRAVRAPLGSLEMRRVRETQLTTHLPGAPDGHYAVLQYATHFEHKEDAVETVVLAMDSGIWKVSGYFIK